MEIEHIGDNKIRCALTEQEIESLGYDIDEIIANSEITQEFMHTVLELVEEQEHIQMEGISPMVKAELLQDHSMAITFGADKEVSLRDLVNTVSHMISQLDPDAASGKTAKAEEGNAQAAADTADTAAAAGTHKRTDPMICALRFSSFENMRRMSLRIFSKEDSKEQSLQDGRRVLSDSGFYGICQGGDASICVRNDRV